MVFFVFKEDEMGRDLVGVREKRNAYRAWWGILRERNDFENLILRLYDNIKTDLI